MTIVRLPFCYTVRFTKKRRKTLLDTFLDGEVSADVPDLSAGDVSPVAEWTNVIFRDDVALNRTRPVSSRAVQWNGSLYVPAGEYMEDTVPADILAKTLSAPLDYVWHYRDVYGFSSSSARFLKIADLIRGYDALEKYGIAAHRNKKPKVEFTPADTMVESDIDTHRELVQRIVDSLAFIDGTTWKKVPSVHFRLNLNTSVKEGWVSVSHGPHGYHGSDLNNGKRSIERTLHHRNFALGDIGGLLRSVGPGVKLSWDVSRVDVIDPVAAEFDGASEYIGRAMEYVIMAHEDSVGALSGALVEDWIAVREELQRHYKRPKEKIDVTTAERLLRLIEADATPHAKRINAEVRDNIATYTASQPGGQLPMPTLGYHRSDLWAA